MEEWLKNPNNARGKISPSSCYIILGGSYDPSIVNKLGLDPYYFNSATIKNSKEMIDLLTKAATLTSFIPKPKVAIFDDLEMLLQHDRVYLNSLLEILEKKKLPNIPIIMIFPESMEKKTRHFVSGGAMLFKADTACAEASTSIREVNFKEDPWLAPLCFHENLEKELTTRTGTVADKRRAYIKYLDALCNWNYMMSKDYTGLAIDLINFETEILLKKFKKKPGASKINANTEFTKMLSQLSLYKKKERAKYTTNDTLFCI